jgi:hypothetical protein
MSTSRTASRCERPLPGAWVGFVPPLIRLGSDLTERLVGATDPVRRERSGIEGVMSKGLPLSIMRPTGAPDIGNHADPASANH